MQLHFLCCTMLIIASKAFPNEFHGSKLLPDFKQRNLKYSSKKYQTRSLKYPVNLVPLSSRLPFHKVSIPTYLMCDKEDNVVSDSSSCEYKKRRIKPEKKREKFKRTLSQSHPPPKSRSSPPQCFMYHFQDSRFHPVGLQIGYPHRHLDKFSGFVPDPNSRLKVFVKNENQYLVCVHSPTNQRIFSKRKKKYYKTFNNRSKLTNLPRQCLTNSKNLAFKRKRSSPSMNFTRDLDSGERPILKSERYQNLETGRNTDKSGDSPREKIKQSRNADDSDDTSGSTNPPPPKVSKKFECERDELFADVKKKKDDAEEEEEEEIEEKIKDPSTKPVTRDLTRVNEILNEVQTMLENYSEEPNVRLNRERLKDKYIAEHDRVIKNKIDKAIPILMQVSEELRDFSADGEELDRDKSKKKKKRFKFKKKLKFKSKKETNKSKKKGVSRKKKKGSYEDDDKDKDKDKEKDKGQEKEKEKNKPREDSEKLVLGCKIDGKWISKKTSVELSVISKSNRILKVTVLSNSEKTLNSHWLVEGLALSDRGGPLILAGIYPKKRKIASFVGQCKTCEGEDILFGSWTITTGCNRCNDLGSSIETVLDVFKRS